MGKKDKKKKKGFGIEKTNAKTDKKLQAKQKKLLQKLGEVKNLQKSKNSNFNHKFQHFRMTLRTWSSPSSPKPNQNIQKQSVLHPHHGQTSQLHP
jgi:hypothetical protein